MPAARRRRARPRVAHGAPAIAEWFRDRGRHVHRPQSHEGWSIGRRADDDAALARWGELVREELAELAATLADETHDDHVCIRAARDLAEQRRLPHTCRREQPDALAARERQ